MKWSEKINDAIEYIEQNLNGGLDYKKAARICCCSLSKFKSLFQFVTDMTISEYIRQRRMSLAAEELINNDIKIVDLALKYDYESPEAFTRAFQTFHGYPPSVTRKFGVYKKYDQLSVRVSFHGGSIKMDTEQNKKFIGNVRPIGWGQTSANPYVGVITACIDALRERGDSEIPKKTGEVYSEYGDFRLAGMISGAGFAYTWSTVESNDANMVDDAMIRRTFNALGYKIKIYRDGDTHNTPPSREKAFYTEQIVKSIDEGYPVIGFGFTTDYPYACVILGYENNGERLYLRSYWDGDSGVPVGIETHHQTTIIDYQFMTDWYKNCRGIVVIEEKIAPALTGKKLLKHCLNAAIVLSEQKTIQFYDLVLPYGLAAYDTMVAVLEDDSYWVMRDEAFLRMMDKSYSCVGLLLADHYRNWIARYWLKENIDNSKAGELINEGCEYYSMLGWLLSHTTGGHNSRTFFENPLDLEKREVRENRIPFIQIVKHLDKSAVDCFKKALALM